MGYIYTHVSEINNISKKNRLLTEEIIQIINI